MSIQSRLTRGIGFGALSVAMLGFAPTTPAPVNEVVWTQGAHGGGGAGNGQPVEIRDWRSINDLFKTDKTKSQHMAMLMADDEVAISVIMQVVLEEMT